MSGEDAPVFKPPSAVPMDLELIMQIMDVSPGGPAASVTDNTPSGSGIAVQEKAVQEVVATPEAEPKADHSIATEQEDASSSSSEEASSSDSTSGSEDSVDGDEDADNDSEADVNAMTMPDSDVEDDSDDEIMVPGPSKSTPSAPMTEATRQSLLAQLKTWEAASNNDVDGEGYITEDSEILEDDFDGEAESSAMDIGVNMEEMKKIFAQKMAEDEEPNQLINAKNDDDLDNSAATVSTTSRNDSEILTKHNTSEAPPSNSNSDVIMEDTNIAPDAQAANDSHSADSESESDEEDDDDNDDDNDDDDDDVDSEANSEDEQDTMMNVATIEAEAEGDEDETHGPLVTKHEMPLPPAQPPKLERLSDGEKLVLAGEVISFVLEPGVEAWWSEKAISSAAQQISSAPEGDGYHGDSAGPSHSTSNGVQDTQVEASNNTNPGDGMAGAPLDETRDGVDVERLPDRTTQNVARTDGQAEPLAEADAPPASTISSSKEADTQTFPLKSGGRNKSKNAKGKEINSAASKFASSGTVLVQAMLDDQTSSSTDEGWLEEGSLLCHQDGRVVAEISETFGPLTSPFYVLRLPPPPYPLPEKADLAAGTRLFYPATHDRTFVPVRVLRTDKRYKGTDASNLFDEEVDEDEMEWSDDEEELLAKQRKKQARKK